MKKHINKIVAGIVIALILVFVYWYGGDSPSTRGFAPEKRLQTTEVSNKKVYENENKIEDVKESEAPEEEKTSQTSSFEPEKEEKNKDSEDSNIQDINKSEESPKKETTEELTCTILIRCDTILENMDWFDIQKHELVPASGIVLEEKTVKFSEGESVFDVLLRETKKNNIHMEFENTPIYNSSYIEGIANIYEFDCGELSGWMYRVNGLFPNYGCSQYILKNGDTIEWLYTCDLGADIGGANSAKNGR